MDNHAIKQYLIGLDIGTTSVKGILVSDKGEIAAIEIY